MYEKGIKYPSYPYTQMQIFLKLWMSDHFIHVRNHRNEIAVREH